MSAHPFEFQLDRRHLRPLYRSLILLNLLFTLTTGAFIYLWSRLDTLSPSLQAITRQWLVQGHLATENVVAAWYSSMLLLGVAVAAVSAFVLDRTRHQAGATRLRHGWLIVAGVFALLSLDEIGSLHERIGMLQSLPGSRDGWYLVLAVPILGVGMFMLAFAWRYLRRVRRAFVLMAAGVVLFLLNPVLEAVEMAMIRGNGALEGTWERTLHDGLLVLEEGGLELFGILCFLSAVLTWIQQTSEERITVTVRQRTVVRLTWAGALLFGAGLMATGALAARLPQGDTGIVQNWFPAAAWLMVALVLATGRAARGTRRALATAGALAVSAALGAGLYGYVPWLATSARWHIPVVGILAATLTLVLETGRAYRFNRSPRPSTASPTLRRPRPNPS